MIALTLEYQSKFENTSSNINKDPNERRNDFKNLVVIQKYHTLPLVVIYAAL